MKRSYFAAATAIFILTAPIGLSQELTDNPQSHETEPEKPGTMSRAGSAATSAIRQTGGGLADAAMSPLEDLNLKRDEIPHVLALLDSPYDLPHALGCYEISIMVQDLDSVLGPDWDAEESAKREWDERAADGLAGAALKAVSSEASGLIPFRGVVRKLTRAEKHAKAYARAFRIGAQRRAFLKGIGSAKQCAGDAAPRPAPHEATTRSEAKTP